MSMICNQCGKTFDGEGIAFCPYCGAKLAAEPAAEIRNEEAEKWVREALAATSYPDRRKILLEGLKACPGSREISWELLFIGEEAPKKGWGIDFSVIQCWVLEIYRDPKAFRDAKQDEMRGQLFDSPKLTGTLQMFEDPAAKQQEYLQRLCRDYVELFLEGSNLVMGNIFGFRTERNKEKKLAVPVAEMIGRIRADEKLLPEQREQLWKAMYQAYGARTGGKMAYLDEQLSQNS